MELWMKVLWALLLGAMILALLPRARSLMAQSRKGSAREWMSVAIPLLLVGGFVALLMLAMRG